MTASVPGWLQRVPIALGALAGLVAVVDFSSVSEKLAKLPSVSAYVAASVGPGLYMVAIGAVFVVIGGLVTDPAKANSS